MVETLASEARLNHQQKRTIIVLVCVVVFLLLLWRRKGPTTNNVTYNKLGGLSVDPQYVNYELPGLDLPRSNLPGDGWDWMQTTDCMCDCSGDDLLQLSPQALVVTRYTYIAGPAISAMPQTPFAVYVPPALPTWWYESGYNVHREPALYVVTSTGVCGILGKYSRGPDLFGIAGKAWPTQTKNVTIEGDDAYIDGKHYKHNPNKDNTVLGPNLSVAHS